MVTIDPEQAHHEGHEGHEGSPGAGKRPGVAAGDAVSLSFTP